MLSKGFSASAEFYDSLGKAMGSKSMRNNSEAANLSVNTKAPLRRTTLKKDSTAFVILWESCSSMHSPKMGALRVVCLSPSPLKEA